MRSVRIYKDDIRVHILRSLFFTDTVLAVSGALVIGGLLFLFFQYVLHYFHWPYYISSLIIGEICFVGIITQKVDNQPIYQIVPRGITFKTSEKQYRQKDLEQYFVDFAIQDNLIIRKNAIVKMLHVAPFDIALLNDQEREHFFLKLKQMIHTLPAQVQFIVRKVQAKPEDYSKHFSSLYDQSNTKREPLIDGYIKDLSNLITENTPMITRNYAVFSVACDTAKPHEKVKAIKKINDMGARFASAMVSCNISVRQLQNDELIQFSKDTLR